jgi:hypothetical protein
MAVMTKQLVIASVVGVLGAGAALAQGGGLSTAKCDPGGFVAGTIPNATKAAQDACQQAYDVYQFMSPQLGLALAGGNATAGQGGVLGGLGHFSVGVRGNVFGGKLPQVDQFTQSTSGAQQQVLPVKDQILGLPTADAAIGLFKGLPLAVTNVGGVDALISASYVPTIDDDNFSITPDNNWQFGWGARVGLLSESIVVPAVSVTWIERDLPTTQMQGSSSGATLRVDNFKVKTNEWRLVVSKSLIMFGVAAGVGQDRYKQSARISATVQNATFCGVGGCPSPVLDADQDLTRTNAFLDVSLNLPFFKVVLEGGQASGGTVDTFNSFADTRADRSQLYGSLGLRFGF